MIKSIASESIPTVEYAQYQDTSSVLREKPNELYRNKGGTSMPLDFEL